MTRPGHIPPAHRAASLADRQRIGEQVAAIFRAAFAKAETDARNADPVVTEYLNRAAEARAAGCYLDPVIGMARARATVERRAVA